MNSYTKFSTFVIVFVIHGTKISCNDNGVDDRHHDERGSLIQLRESLSSTANLHSNWTGPPCHNDRSRWFGITCSSSHVVGIDLHGIQLAGELPPMVFQNLSRLTNLNLSDNVLYGELPALAGLIHLSVVSLSRNRFSGSIPVDYVALPSISRLELQDNLLNGTIPPFDQRSLMVFDVSYNFLRGRIPETLVLERFSKASYDNNLELCGMPLDRACDEAPKLTPSKASPPSNPTSNVSTSSSSPAKSTSTESLEVWNLALITTAAVVVPASVVLCFLCYTRKHKKVMKLGYNHVGHAEELKDKKDDIISKSTEELEFFNKERKVFDLDELLRSSAEVIGKGKLGLTYKANMESGSIVVVKRLKVMSGVSRKEFVQQMQLLAGLRHENLVQIISYYYSIDEKLVIYEHISSGRSLFQLLHGQQGGGKIHLNWAARLSIVTGIARGLSYLHRTLPPHIVPHGNLKSSNIIVEQEKHHNECNAKLTDLGLLELLTTSPGSVKRLAAGKSPEFSRGQDLTEKADVFCFGVVLLEIITGLIPSDDSEELLEWARKVMGIKWSTDYLEAQLVGEEDVRVEMFKVVQVALDCVEIEPAARPEMSEVVRRIEEIHFKKLRGKEIVSV